MVQPVAQSTVSPDKAAAGKNHNPVFAGTSSEKVVILPITAQTHEALPRNEWLHRGSFSLSGLRKRWQNRNILVDELSRLPRFPLAHLPTPLEFLPQFTVALGGLRIWFKRDDCPGLAFYDEQADTCETLNLAGPVEPVSDIPALAEQLDALLKGGKR